MGILEGDADLAAALALVVEGQLDEAEAAIGRLAAEQRAAGALLLGAIASRRGDAAAALAATGRAVQLALDDGEALAALAATQLALGRPAFARPPAERAARLAADLAAGHAALAAAQQRAAATDQALASVRRAAVAAALLGPVRMRADTPGFRAVARELGERLVTAGQEERARKFQAMPPR
jgi:tetratricopeptide (TPR) repeat protein